MFSTNLIGDDTELKKKNRKNTMFSTKKVLIMASKFSTIGSLCSAYAVFWHIMASMIMHLKYVVAANPRWCIPLHGPQCKGKCGPWALTCQWTIQLADAMCPHGHGWPDPKEDIAPFNGVDQRPKEMAWHRQVPICWPSYSSSLVWIPQ